MEPKNYVVARIEGEYAILKDTESGEELFIALALLPLGVAGLNSVFRALWKHEGGAGLVP